jgi:hypothetical protein
MQQTDSQSVKNPMTDNRIQQELAIEPYSEPDESIPHPNSQFYYDSA